MRGGIRYMAALVAVGFVSGVAIAVVLLAWPLLLASVWPRIAPAMASPVWRALTTVVLCQVAVLMFAVREDFRRLYGFAEAVGGVVAIWFALGVTPAEPTTTTFGVLGGVYILVRGFDNLARGQETIEEEQQRLQGVRKNSVEVSS